MSNQNIEPIPAVRITPFVRLRKNTMNRILYYTVLPLAAFLIGCSQEEPKEPSTSNDEEVRKAIEEFYMKPKEEMFALLAIKYNLPSNKIDAVMHTYLSNHDRMYMMIQNDGPFRMDNSSFETKPITETIKILEREYGIPSDILASMIIDYKIWNSAEQAGSE